jgi:type IV pilus assembly protein PilA
MDYTKRRCWGFTLIELLIVMCIVGILVALAVPSYRTYTRRAHYTELVQAAAPFKLGVHECYSITGDLASCHSGQNGIPLNIIDTPEESLVASITTSGAGVITITPRTRFGINKDDLFILIPQKSHDQLVWHTSGKGVSNGYSD